MKQLTALFKVQVQKQVTSAKKKNMTNARRVVGDTSKFAHMFIHKVLQNQLNQYLDSLALFPQQKDSWKY